jgi:hypothetical protein
MYGVTCCRGRQHDRAQDLCERVWSARGIAHLSNAIHLALAGLSSRVYVEWVPGKANPADLPSRAHFVAGPATGLLSLTLSIQR